jgi:hypothetical protein
MDARLAWLVERMAATSNYPDLIEGGQWHRWIMWALKHNFVLINNPPTWGCIARPISKTLYETRSDTKFLWSFDSSGDWLWMDWLYAPGQWSTVVQFLIASGKRWGAWQHRTTSKVHLVDIKKLINRNIH